MSKQISSLRRGHYESQTEAKADQWPDGARIAITPCVAFETWPEDLGGPNTLQQENRRSFPRNAVTKRNLAIITDREFGERVGIYRMLEIFEQEKIHTSFFPTGITVQNYPEIFKEIAEQGHEVGTETWIHDYSYMKKRDKEKKDLQKTVEAVKKSRRQSAGGLSFHRRGAERVHAGNYLPSLVIPTGWTRSMRRRRIPSR
jgi:allantoinase